MKKNYIGQTSSVRRLTNIESLIQSREKALIKLRAQREYFLIEQRNLKLTLLLEF